jgi:MYXO-CTERM domain-containing protein
MYRADQGWIPIVDVDASTNLIFQAVHNGAAYRYLNPENAEEAFFWSNVQSSGRFETIQGDGLLLLHFDMGIGNNDPPNPLSLAVVQADGLEELDQEMWPMPGSDVDDYFRAEGVDEFSAETHSTNTWNDGSATGLRIYDVAAVSTSMEFKVGYGTPTVADAGAPDAGSAGSSSGSGGDVGSGGNGGTATIGGAGLAGLPGAGGTTPIAGSANTGTGAAAPTMSSAAPKNDVAGACACRLGTNTGGDRRSAGLMALGGLALLWRMRRRER